MGSYRRRRPLKRSEYLGCESSNTHHRSAHDLDFLTLSFSSSRISTSPNAWNSNHCLATFRTLTQFILRTIVQTDVLPLSASAGLAEGDELPKPVVWRLSFRPRTGLECEIVDYKAGEGRWAFLREDYVKSVIGSGNR
jgi:hypothetical protein